MQSLDPQVFTQLTKIARERGISMQELIRAVIVPDWMRKLEDSSRRVDTSRRSGRHAKRLRRLRPTARV